MTPLSHVMTRMSSISLVSFVSLICIKRKSLEHQRPNAHFNITKTYLALRARIQVHKVLNMLQNMAVNVIRNTNSDEKLRNEAIRSLCALVRTTGSVSHLLNLLQALLSLSSSFTLDDAAASSARRLTKALLDRFYDNAAFILAEEDTLAVGDTSSMFEHVLSSPFLFLFSTNDFF